MDTAQEENANADGKVNGVDKPSDNSEQTEPKDEPMNTDKEGIAAEKENQDTTNENQKIPENGKSDQSKADTQKKPKKRKITKDLIVDSNVPELTEKELNTLVEKELEL